MQRFLLFLCGFILAGLLPSTAGDVRAQTIMDQCDGRGIVRRGPSFTPGGIILTSFDRDSLWVYNIDSGARYPLPETRPCSGNCHLTPDARRVSYVDPQTNAFGTMFLDGTGRAPLIGFVQDIRFWDTDTLLVWTADHRAFVRSISDPTAREELDTLAVRTIQPGGAWAVQVRNEGQTFGRYMTELATGNSIRLGSDPSYGNAAVWSPDGADLAYVGQPGTLSSELYLTEPGSVLPVALTNFSEMGQTMRIGGFNPLTLTWSPDSTRVAFWVTELRGPDPENDTGPAMLYVADVRTGATTRYCDLSIGQHTPNPPKLSWSPDGTHIAFGVEVPQDGKGALLLALDTASGRYTELSDGIYPARTNPDVFVWGLAP